MNLIPPITATPVGALPGNGLEPGDNPLAGIEGPIFYEEFVAALSKGAGGEGAAVLAGSPGDSTLAEGESPEGDLQGLPVEVTSQLVDQANFSPSTAPATIPAADDASVVALDTKPVAPVTERSAVVVNIVVVAPVPQVAPAGPLLAADALSAAGDLDVPIKAVGPQPVDRSARPQGLISAGDLSTVSLVAPSEAEKRVQSGAPTVIQNSASQDSPIASSKDTSPAAYQVTSTPVAAAVKSGAGDVSEAIPAPVSKATRIVSSVDRQASIPRLSAAEIAVSPDALVSTVPSAVSPPVIVPTPIANQPTAAANTPQVISSEARDGAASLVVASQRTDAMRTTIRSVSEIPTQSNAITAVDLDVIDPVVGSAQRITSVNVAMREDTTENSELNEALIENNATQWRVDTRGSVSTTGATDSANRNEAGAQSSAPGTSSGAVPEAASSTTAAEKFVSTLLGIATSSQPASAADRTISELKQTTTIVSAPHMARWDAAAVQVELVRMIKDGGGQVVMKLTPPDEGSFRIDLSLDPERGVRIFVEGASDSVRTRLEQGAEQLREQFSQMGFNLQLDMQSRREAFAQSGGFGFTPSDEFGDSSGTRSVGSDVSADADVVPAPRRRSIVDESQVYFRA